MCNAGVAEDRVKLVSLRTSISAFLYYFQIRRKAIHLVYLISAKVLGSKELVGTGAGLDSEPEPEA